MLPEAGLQSVAGPGLIADCCHVRDGRKTCYLWCDVSKTICYLRCVVMTPQDTNQRATRSGISPDNMFLPLHPKLFLIFSCKFQVSSLCFFFFVLCFVFL